MMKRHLWIVCSVVFAAIVALPCRASAASITETKAAIGQGCVASGDNSTAMGWNTTAGGEYSTAMGISTTAWGGGSTAMGFLTVTGGLASTAMGYGTMAYADYSTVIGSGWGYSLLVNWSPNSFMVGYMNSETDTSPDFFVKDGAVGIGTETPGQALDIDKGNLLVRGVGSFGSPGDAGIVYLGDVHHYVKGVNGYGVKLGTYGVGDAISILQGSGNVGIGTTTPGYRLEVNGDAAKTSGTTWINSSDGRLKDITGEYTRGLDAVASLRPITFHYKEGNPRGLPSEDENIGFIAQEVQEVFPEAVNEGPDGYLDFNMHPVNVALVNAVRELKAENEALKAENAAMRKDIARIKAALGM